MTSSTAAVGKHFADEKYSLWVCEHQYFGEFWNILWTTPVIVGKYYQTLSSYECVLKTLTQSSSDIITVLCSVMRTQLCSAWNVKTLIKPVLSLSGYTKSAQQNTVGSFPDPFFNQHIWSFHYKANPELSDLSTKSGQICFVFKLIRYSPLDGVVNTFSVPRYKEFCCCFEFVCILWSNIYKLYYAEQFPRSITIYTKQAFDGFFK